MTREEAKQAISDYYCHTDLLDEYGDYCDQTEYEKAFDMAIRSLEAWDKVLNDIKEIDNMSNWSKHSSDYWHGFSDVVDIMGKRLQEVKE